MQAKQPKRYYSDKQLARRYGVSRATIWNWAKRGVLPRPHRLGPNTSRWPETEIAEHEAAAERGVA